MQSRVEMYAWIYGLPPGSSALSLPSSKLDLTFYRLTLPMSTDLCRLLFL